ncbi:putative deaminase [Serratia entomophila]|nr:putative deaminase [Serratia entomophila]
MEKTQQQSRRAFLSQTGKITTACAVIGLTGGVAQAAPAAAGQCDPQPMSLTDRHYLLSEVRLEDGFEYDGETVIGTRTALYQLEIKDGKIAAIHAADAAPPAGIPRYKARGQLLLPAFRDMHIHLDKTFYSGPWQAPRPRQGKTIMDMIALEQTLIPKLLPTSQQRAENLIALLQSKGSTVARSHCNIDPVSGEEPGAPAARAGKSPGGFQL